MTTGALLRPWRWTGVWVFGLACAAGLVAAQAADSAADGYVKKSSWAETMLATRAAVVQRLASQQLDLGAWSTTGPLKSNAFSEALFPEQGVDLQAKSPDGQPLWHPHPEWTDGQVHMLDGSYRASTYLFRTVKVPAAVAVEASLGSDDGCELWLNGRKVHSHDIPRGPAPDQDRVSLTLQPGENRLLLKIHNNSGGHGFYFRLGQLSYAGGVEPTGSRLPPANRLDPAALGGRPALGVVERRGAGGLAATDDPAGPPRIGRRRAAVAGRVGAVDRRESPGRECPLAGTVRAGVPVPLPVRRGEGHQPARLAPGDRGPEQHVRTAVPREAGILEAAGGLGASRERDGTGSGRRRGSAADATASLVRDAGQLRQDALLANPLLNFDRLLLVQPQSRTSWACRRTGRATAPLPRDGYDNEIAVLSPVRPAGPADHAATSRRRSEFVGDVDLHFDADRMLFSMPGTQRPLAGLGDQAPTAAGLRQVTPGDEPDVDNYDPCYLPDGRIIFASTRCFHGVPCVGGGNTVANLCLMNADGTGIRQLCFDQDHNWCPTVLNNGRVLYTRWEYSDSPHYFTRLLFHMNPDGTGQMEYYGSNSYLAQLDLLRPADPRPSDQGRRRHLRPPRRAADGRAGRVRSGPGPARGRRRGAAHPRPRPEGRAGHPRRRWSTAPGRSSSIPIR